MRRTTHGYRLARHPDGLALNIFYLFLNIMLSIGIAGALVGCTQKTQTQLSRDWTGTNGVLEVYAGATLVKRFLSIDKLSTAYGTQDTTPRPHRFGYGVLDADLNGRADPWEKRVYFEFSDYATPYVFYEKPD
jgi:hypothetical protein